MRKKKNNKWMDVSAFGLYIAVFLFLIYMFFQAGVSIYEKRSPLTMTEVTVFDYKEIEDETSPTKKTRVFERTLSNVDKQEEVFAFYVSHSYVKVYIDDDLVYELKNTNKNISTVGNNYIYFPLYKTDIGKRLKIEISPVYDYFLKQNIIFYQGSWQGIYTYEIYHNLPQIFLAFLCIIMGIFLCCLDFYFTHKKQYANKLVYLGLFILSLGLWKICDTRATPLLFPDIPVFITYLSLIMFYLAPVSFLIYIYYQFDDEHLSLKRVIPVAIFIPTMAIILELLNILELREVLLLNHSCLILYIVLLLFACIKDWQDHKRLQFFPVLVISFIMGVLLDFLVYYVKGSSSQTIFLLLAVVIDVIAMAILSIKKLHYRSDIDALTGLYNNNRCKEILENGTYEKFGLLVFDLNGLKKINDTLGHTYGDKMIKEFSNILQKVIPKSSFAGRFGGDEFIVILYDVTEEKVTSFLENMENKVTEYNKENKEISISYSVGYGMSMQKEAKTMKEIFNEADEKMYENKEKYYQVNHITPYR